MKVIQQNLKWYRRLRPAEMVLATDYVAALPGHVRRFRRVKGSWGSTVIANRHHFKVRAMYYREIEPLLGQMVAARQRARRERK